MKREFFIGFVLGFLVLSASAQHPEIGEYNVYFGSLHNHSNVSDGSGTPATAFNYARNTAHLDFFGLSDHSTYLNSAQWADIRSQADASNEDGVFTTFYGFEWSSKAGYGHVTVFNTIDYCPATSPTLSLHDLLSWLEARPAGLAYFNHPGDEDSIGIEFDHFSTAPSNQLIGIELWNRNRGFSRFYYNDGYYRNDNNKSYIDEANNRGWQLGALGSDDNHTGTWGTDVPYRMAILSNTLTRNDLLGAIQARRFYATLDKNLALSFKINRLEMGSSVPAGNDTILIQAYDSDNEIFTNVVLYNGNHDIVNAWSMNNDTVRLSMNLSTAAGDYYYVKVTEADGDEAISSPVWIVAATANKYPVCSIISPLNNSAFEAPASVIINADAADADGLVSKVEFYQGTTKLGEDLSAPYSFTWSNVTPGTYSLTVRATDNDGAISTSLPVQTTVTRRLITVMADGMAKIYGKADPVLTYRITSGTLFGSDSFTGALKRDAGENAGTYRIRQGTLALNSNYSISFADADFSIIRSAVTVTADGQSKGYGNSDPVLTYRVTSGSLVAGDSFSGSLTRFAGEAAGSYSILQGSLGLGLNYNLSFISAQLTILPKPIDVAADPQTKIYGAADPLLTYRITSGGMIATDAFTGSLVRDTGENIGIYSIRQGTLDAGNNYTLSFTGANLVIEKSDIVITANSESKIYGDVDPQLTYTITSGVIVTRDTINGELVREPGEDIGKYTIGQGSLKLSNNYNLQFTGADFEIIPRAITVTANYTKKIFGYADPELTYTITSGNLIGSDTFTGMLVRDKGENIGTYEISRGDLSLPGNYILTFIGADFRITSEFELKVYPNPFSDHIFFELELNIKKYISIEIFSQDGKKIATVFAGDADPDFYHFLYVPNHLSTGLIIYRLTMDGLTVAVNKAVFNSK